MQRYTPGSLLCLLHRGQLSWTRASPACAALLTAVLLLKYWKDHSCELSSSSSTDLRNLANNRSFVSKPLCSARRILYNFPGEQLASVNLWYVCLQIELTTSSTQISGEAHTKAPILVCPYCLLRSPCATHSRLMRPL
jgi:hypothetical protein